MKHYVYLFSEKTGEYEKHVRGCGEHLVDQVNAAIEWAEKWPNFCQKCKSSGETRMIGASVPYGMGNVHLPDDRDPCPECIGPGDIVEMRCPRCGKKIYNSIVFNHYVPRDDDWLVKEYGQDGIVESWLEREGPCPECGWSNGASGDDFMPGMDGCLCHEFYFYGDGSQPGRFQKLMFRLFGERLQNRLWPHLPIMKIKGGVQDVIW